MRLTPLYVAALASATAGGAQTMPAGTAADADRIIKGVWDAHLRYCGTSAFEVLDDRVVLELDQPQFHLAPTRLQPAATQNGYEYQTTAIAAARRWRWAPLSAGRRGAWTPWQEGQTLTVRFDQFGGERGQTTVQNAVLQFDLVRKDGNWTANRPLSPLNSEFHAFDPTADLPAVRFPACDALTR